ncbi:unnamed protein product [Periconia digitata]|uniref:Cytochrome P450 n=1 Tax=Periconia digitata TaxID=1303443 RepID=A0A9W4UPB0_9PLEO|nr:unnamed protein product [Periconia digitata]
MGHAVLDWMVLHPAISTSVAAISVYILFNYVRQKHQPVLSSLKRPINAPNKLPLLGHTIPFTLDTPNFTTMLTKRFHGIPLRLRLLATDIVYLTSSEHVAALFRQSSEVTNRPYRKWVNSTFSVPKEFQNFFYADTTGISRTPLPGTDTKPENRVEYIMHSLLVEFLTGSRLQALAARFTLNMEDRLRKCGSVDADADTEHDCLYRFVKHSIFHSSVKALFGTGLFDIDPEFSTRFWDFEMGVPELGKGLPRFVYPSQHRARDACLETVRAWHENLDKKRTADPDLAARLSQQDYDDTFGSCIVKKRHAAFSRMDVMSIDVRAAEDFALIWGNANTTHATFWLIHAIVRSSSTLERFRFEIQKVEVRGEGGFTTYDVDALCAIPFVQSLYAETLRLYVCNIILRTPHSRTLSIDGWGVQKGEIVAAVTYPMHRDSSRFNTGSEKDPRPLDEFWAERFLVKSGVDRDGVEFSLKGSEDAWFPYGGGSSICPGRFFAKQEMLVTAALLIGNYDVVLASKEVEIDWRYFGTGVLGVKGKQPFQLRSRARL